MSCRLVCQCSDHALVELFILHLIQVKDSTGEDTRQGVTVTSSHEEELPGSKGTANFALKWARDSKHVASLNIKEIEKELKVKSKEKIKGYYTAEDEGSFVGIVAFECRGMDVTGWQPEVGAHIHVQTSMLFLSLFYSHISTKAVMPALNWRYLAQDGFIVESKSGARFEDVDLSEKEWMDYDEKLGESIGIYDLEYKLQGVKV